MEIPNIELMRERLREARESYGLSQRELGELIGASKTVVAGLESVTAMKAIHLENIVAVADALDVSIDWLFGRTNEAGIREVPKLVDKPVVVKFFNPKWNAGENRVISISEK